MADGHVGESWRHRHAASEFKAPAPCFHCDGLVLGASLHNPDFAAYARDCGALGIRVESAEQLDGALREAMAHDGPALVAIVADAALI